MNITLVVSSLANGGAERVMSTLANYWAGQGWCVTLLTFDDGTQPFYKVHERVHWRPLDIEGISGNRLHTPRRSLRRLWILRQAIQNSPPQVILAFVDKTNVLTLLASRRLGVPVIISERVSPLHWSIGSWGWRWLRRWLYPQAAYLVLQTEAALRYYPPAWRRRVRVVPNAAIARIPDSVQLQPSPEAPMIIAMGRLTPQKGFDLLLQAFAVVAPRYPHWRLTIWGEGPERENLEALQDALGLHRQVDLPGCTSTPGLEMARASLFVLSSRFEGFPNVLCEAMAIGLPVISCDCPDGPRELICNGSNGLLVPPEDVDALTTALEHLMGNDPLRQQLGQRALEVLEQFSQERVMALWSQVMLDALST